MATLVNITRQKTQTTSQIAKMRQDVDGESVLQGKMADDELEAIRAKRMAELQQQMVRTVLLCLQRN